MRFLGACLILPAFLCPSAVRAGHDPEAVLGYALLEDPRDLAVQRDDLYIADGDRLVQMEFTATGLGLRFITAHNAMECHPHDYAFNTRCVDTPIYVEADDHQIYVMNDDGSLGRLGTDWLGADLKSGRNLGRAVAADGTGNLYIADKDGYRILKLAPLGDVLEILDGSSTGAGMFEPVDVEVSTNGDLLVSDALAGRVILLDTSGHYLGEFGGFGSGKGQFGEAGYLVTDWYGNIYASDPGNHRIQKFSPDGKFLLAWGEYGSEVGQFNEPRGLAMRFQSGLLLVADTGNRRILGFRVEDSDLPPPPDPPPPPPPPPTPERPDPRDPAMVLHIEPATPQGPGCLDPAAIPQIRTQAEAREDGTASYHVYVIAAAGIPEGTSYPGITGIQLGVEYSPEPALKVWEWKQCSGGLQFPQESWPGSGAGNTLTWACANDLKLAGYFYVTAYAPSTMSVVPFPNTGKLKTANCGGAEIELDLEVGLDRAGWINLGNFGSGANATGCNPLEVPCAPLTPVRPATWGNLKSRYLPGQ